MPAENGVVYTKRWVVDMILDLSGYIPGSGIVDKTIVEPSCGCGAFMTVIAERLSSEVLSCGREWGEIAGSVRGFEIDPEAIAVTKSSVAAVLEQNGCPEDTATAIADAWITLDDFILSDVPSCDFVAGNPPYVRATEIDREKRDRYCDALDCMTSGCDLYIGFFDKGLDILREGGVLCFICADRWLQNSYGKCLRGRVGKKCHIADLVRMHGVDAFDEMVDAYPAVTLIRKEPAAEPLRFVNCSSDFSGDDVGAVMEWLSNPCGPKIGDRYQAFEVSRPNGADVYSLGDIETVSFVSEAREKLPDLKEAGVRIGIGIATGCDDVFLTEDENVAEPSRMLPIFHMRDYRRGHAERKRWLVNPWNDDGTLVDIDEYPKMKAYFESNSERLRARHVAKKSGGCWYRTIDKVIPGLADRDLLLMPDMAAQPDPVLSHGLYPHHNCYWISSDEWDLPALGGILMADTTRRFIDAQGVKMRGGTLRFQAQYLKLVRIPRYSEVAIGVREGLREAFEARDREKATRFAEMAYKEAMR